MKRATEETMEVIPISKEEFEEIRDCAGALEEVSQQLMQSHSPYLALKLIAGKLHDIIDAAETRKPIIT